MIEVYERFYVGNQIDYEKSNFVGSCVLAAKEPWHRRAVGYSGRACSKDHPEYLMAQRGNTLILNLVDAPKPEFFDKRIIDAALDFIDIGLNSGNKVLICCNQGESRSPSIALLYLIKNGIINGATLEECEAEFLRVYPKYNPATGIRGFLNIHFNDYSKPSLAF